MSYQSPDIAMQEPNSVTQLREAKPQIYSQLEDLPSIPNDITPSLEIIALLGVLGILHIFRHRIA